MRPPVPNYPFPEMALSFRLVFVDNHPLFLHGVKTSSVHDELDLIICHILSKKCGHFPSFFTNIFRHVLIEDEAHIWVVLFRPPIQHPVIPVTIHQVLLAEQLKELIEITSCKATRLLELIMGVIWYYDIFNIPQNNNDFIFPFPGAAQRNTSWGVF